MQNSKRESMGIGNLLQHSANLIGRVEAFTHYQRGLTNKRNEKIKGKEYVTTRRKVIQGRKRIKPTHCKDIDRIAINKDLTHTCHYVRESAKSKGRVRILMETKWSCRGHFEGRLQVSGLICTTEARWEGRWSFLK